MNESITAALLFLLLLLSSASGLLLQGRLAERHRSRETVDAVRLVISILVTFTALVSRPVDLLGQDRLRRVRQPDARLQCRHDRAGPAVARIRRRRQSGARAAPQLCRGRDRRHLARRAAPERLLSHQHHTRGRRQHRGRADRGVDGAPRRVRSAASSRRTRRIRRSPISCRPASPTRWNCGGG